MAQAVHAKFVALGPFLDEQSRRRWAAVEARAIGRGGIERVAEATGLSRTTIRAGLKELERAPEDAPVPGRQRGPGAGRKRLTAHDPGLLLALEKLVDPVTRGDPMEPLRWTCSSAARLAQELRARGHRASERTVNRMLHEAGYSLQANHRTRSSCSTRYTIYVASEADKFAIRSSIPRERHMPDDLTPLRETAFAAALNEFDELLTQSDKAFLLGAGCSKCGKRGKSWERQPNFVVDSR